MDGTHVITHGGFLKLEINDRRTGDRGTLRDAEKQESLGRIPMAPRNLLGAGDR